MLIEQLKLENIGSYKDNNTINLSIHSPKKNVILIGGENGAGKTTFLNAIKLGLFGCYGYGHKTENADYHKRVYSYLNASARKNEHAKFSITITFSEVENYRRNVYTFRRAWKVNGQSIKEQFDITKNGTILNNTDKDIYQSRLRENFPPKLFDLCLFDGEEISKIINENKLSSYLQELSTVVFNLDLFKSLEHDLYSYLQQSIDEEQRSTIEKEIISLQKDEREKLIKIAELEKKILDKKDEKRNIEETYISIKKDFETHGGLLKDERDQYNQDMLKIENHRKKNAEQVREFIQTFLPFYLNQDLLFVTQKQIEDEEKSSLFNHLTNELTTKNLSSIMNRLQENTSPETISQLREEILTIVKPQQNNFSYIHRISSSQRMEIDVIAQVISKEHHATYIQLLEENKQLLGEAQKLRKKINTHDNANEFTLMLENMEQLHHNIITLERALEDMESFLDQENQVLQTIQTTIESKQHIVEQSNKTQNSFLIAQNIMKLSTEFQNLQHHKKLQQVQIEATKMLNKLMRKQHYISSVRINPETFELLLYDVNRDVVTKETLSAGEKEILLLSLIWAIFKCSGRRVPFIFDTLLGRLDQTHKRNILLDFIPSCGEQVLILSTNSEVDEGHYKLLEEHVSHRYLLDFNIVERKTYVSNAYFNFKEEEQKV